MTEDLAKYLDINNLDKLKNKINWDINSIIYPAGNKAKIINIHRALDEYIVEYQNLNYTIAINRWHLFNNYETYIDEDINNFFYILKSKNDYKSNIKIQSLFLLNVKLSLEQILYNKNIINWYLIIKYYPQYYKEFIKLICNLAKNINIEEYKNEFKKKNNKNDNIRILKEIIDAFIIHHSQISEKYFHIFLEQYISFLSFNQVLHIIKKMELNDNIVYIILQNLKEENLIDILLNFQYENLSSKLRNELCILQKFKM